MVKKFDSNAARLKRHKRVRAKISGTAECPRLCVFRSSKNIYAQVIDDVAGVTLCAAGSNEKDFEIYGGNCEAAAKVGKAVAERALAKGIEKSRGMIENAMNGVTSDLTITPRVMAAQGGYSGSAASSGDLISGINTALNTALAGGGSAGDIVIPVYIGGDMIDEIVVTAQQRMNLRSGGR